MGNMIVEKVLWWTGMLFSFLIIAWEVEEFNTTYNIFYQPITINSSAFQNESVPYNVKIFFTTNTL